METFTQYQAYLFSIAYRMLGSVMDAEDMVQEAWLRWQKSDQPQIESPKSYLAAITTRLCIDFLRSARVTRETYIGPWLPEPLVAKTAVDGEEMVMQADSLSMAFLKLLEQLSPTERAVFLLRHVFDYEYREIAPIVAKSEGACRQIFSRARKRLAQDQTHQKMSFSQQEAVMNQLWQACISGDLEAIKQFMAEDIVMMSDGGGVVTAARKPIRSAERVSTFLLGIMRLAPEGLSTESTIINGQPGTIVRADGQIVTVFVLDIQDGRVQHIFSVLNPNKLKHL